MRATASASPASATPFSWTQSRPLRCGLKTHAQTPSLPTVATMQPYFIRYAGYFRLFAASDLFVTYDCVQFPRHGWVHRKKMVAAGGRECWLTPPLANRLRDVRIRDLSVRARA